jgi:hypothetical protein
MSRVRVCSARKASASTTMTTENNEAPYRSITADRTGAFCDQNLNTKE